MIHSCYDDFSYLDKPTEKQLKCISIIENNLNIVFKGATKKAATQFIKENIDKSYKSVKIISSVDPYDKINSFKMFERDPFYDEDETDDYWDGCNNHYDIDDDFHCRWDY